MPVICRYRRTSCSSQKPIGCEVGIALWKALQPFFKLTPIYTVCYGPAKLIVDFRPDKCVEILAAQVLYLAAGCGLMFFVYRKGVKKLYVNGG